MFNNEENVMGRLHHLFPTEIGMLKTRPKGKRAGFEPAPTFIADKPGIDGKAQALDA